MSVKLPFFLSWHRHPRRASHLRSTWDESSHREASLRFSSARAEEFGQTVPEWQSSSGLLQVEEIFSPNLSRKDANTLTRTHKNTQGIRIEGVCVCVVVVVMATIKLLRRHFLSATGQSSGRRRERGWMTLPGWLNEHRENTEWVASARLLNPPKTIARLLINLSTDLHNLTLTS